MKKKLLIALACLCVFGLFGCTKAEQTEKDGKYRVLCTVFPAYDWLRNVAADAQELEITLLDTHGADLHSYQPTV